MRVTRRATRYAGAAVIALAAFASFGSTAADAHPLGNFSVNHSHNLTFAVGRVEDLAVVDFAEIPTEQSRRAVDTDGDGTASPTELAAFGSKLCEQVRASTNLNVDANRVVFAISSVSFAYQPGQAGLPTSRMECVLNADADLSARRTVTFNQTFYAERVGWREITAVGNGVRLIASSVPSQSTSDTLRSFPTGALDSPLNLRTVTLSMEPGSELTTVVPTGRSARSPSIFKGGAMAGVVDRITARFNDLVGRRDLTVGVGLLAVALALILGASHALLPGHGKTVMAAYIAGRQGSARDAVIVGATVTATHTSGVLILGLLLTVSSALAGPSVLSWLGIASGLLIAGLGGSLLRNAIQHRTPSHSHHEHSHHGHGQHGHGDHEHGDHEHGDHEHGDHSHSHDHHGHSHKGVTSARTSRRRTTVHAAARAGLANGIVALDTTDIAVLDRPRVTTTVNIRKRQLSARSPSPEPVRVSRRGLVGMGVAGGLVPSPSALIVLLSAIALGRTAFGVLLVVAYGLGMAATLTVAGLLLVRIRNRYQQRPSTGRIGVVAERWRVVSPYATALLVVVVGLGLAVRSLGSL
jgi:nickel/cobalt transporter (NicO) family protein